MNLSNETVSVLKNFSTINQNLVIKEGSSISTMSAMKNIVSRAEVSETFPRQFAIYDLNEFLSALSLFSEPDLDFQDDFVLVTNDKGDKLQFYYSDPSVVSAPTKEITMPDADITFTLSNEQLNDITKAAIKITNQIHASVQKYMILIVVY